MTANQLANIERALGEIQGTVKAIQNDMVRDRQESKEARQRTYERVEKVEESVGIAGQTAAQARDKADAVEKLVAEEVKPQTDKIKHLGLKGGGFLAGAAMVGGLVSGPIWTNIASAFEKLTK